MVVLNYEHLKHLPSLPLELKFKIMKEAKKSYQSDKMIAQFGTYHEFQPGLDTALKLDKEDLDYQRKTGGVGFFDISQKYAKKIREHYKKFPLLSSKNFAVQVVCGGTYVAPHIDPPKMRKEGYLYILQPGGPSVTTTWYKVKDEYSHIDVDHSKGLPHKLLEPLESHVLAQDSWHYFNHTVIHGVENQPELRLALWAF